jgi:hypothetical protein
VPTLAGDRQYVYDVDSEIVRVSALRPGVNGVNGYLTVTLIVVGPLPI